MAAVKECLAEGANVNGRDQSGWTALHRAAFKGRIECVQVLVSHGAEVDAVDGSDFSVRLLRSLCFVISIPKTNSAVWMNILAPSVHRIKSDFGYSAKDLNFFFIGLCILWCIVRELGFRLIGENHSC
nr:ankyrin repeat domain-containing protein 65-like [Ipomoea trifida]